MTTRNDEARPAGNGTGIKSSGDGCTQIVPLNSDQRSHVEAVQALSPKAIGGAHAVLVWTPEGKYTRRLYLSLHAADKALERAKARGLTASCVMVELMPVAALPVIVVGGEDR